MSLNPATTPWYILYDGSSPDGRGTADYVVRTLDEKVARKHHDLCNASAYSTGYVDIITQYEIKRMH